jgi:putative transposase
MEDFNTDERQLVELRLAVENQLRARVLEAIQVTLEEELEVALGCKRYERSCSRSGYRNGRETRRITTEMGSMELDIPRGRISVEDGSTKEFQSRLLPRYARRTRRVDEAILGVYLAGGNTRRIRKALSAFLGQQNLSKSAISRIIQRLKSLFEHWSCRDLSEEHYLIVFLDALHLKVRLARRVVCVPVLAVLGVAPGGDKRLLALELAASEAAACWGSLLEDLNRRGLPAPCYVVTDGHKGLVKAVELWPQAKIQRCTVHKLRNLRQHCPAHARAEMTRDYHKIIHAKDAIEARKAYQAFIEKWSRLVPAVARSLQEAGYNLLTFYELPKAMWKSVRSTNNLENLNREFTRRTKTQGSFSTEHGALVLLFALVAFGQIQLRKIDGFKEMRATFPKLVNKAA